MFKFNLLNPWPWDRGIEPDATNEKCDVYLEEFMTERLHKDSYGGHIHSMRNWYVALVKFKEDGDVTWIISDGKGVLDEAKSIEQLGVLCDKWKLLKHGRA